MGSFQKGISFKEYSKKKPLCNLLKKNTARKKEPDNESQAKRVYTRKDTSGKITNSFP